MTRARACRAITAIVFLGAASLLAPQDVSASPLDAFRDPDDGQIDLSEWLLDRKGFLPVPIFITEPAVGYGGGLAAVFFRDSIRDRAGKKGPSGDSIPPDIFAVVLAATDNGTKFGGGGGMVSFADDRWRYRGGVAKTSANLDFFGIGGSLDGGERNIAYNLDGWISLQQLLYRLGSSNTWITARWAYLDLTSSLQASNADDAILPPVAFARRSSGVGPTIEYDSRDNIFTPSSGWTGSLDLTFYGPGVGSDHTFQAYRGHAFAYWPVSRELVLGGRVDGRAARGDVPFFMYPFVDLRGVPLGRLQDRNTGVIETEAQWKVTPRWSLIGFVGAGRAWGSKDTFSEAPSAVGEGLGFRYLIARRLGLYAGLDYAHSNYDHAFYIQIGSAWR